jgi:hypothetical protein
MTCTGYPPRFNGSPAAICLSNGDQPQGQLAAFVRPEDHTEKEWGVVCATPVVRDDPARPWDRLAVMGRVVESASGLGRALEHAWTPRQEIRLGRRRL